MAIQFQNVTKKFPGVIALDNVSFSVKKGQIHAIVGENGAGKSTLLNILHGIYNDYEGKVLINDLEVKFNDAKEALSQGIVKVHQEVTMIEELTVGQNIVLGYEPTNKIFINNREIHQQVNNILKELNVSFKSEDLAKKLNIGEMQMASIAKALYHKAKIISLDEPTASLSAKEIKSLFSVINNLKKQGITVIYISHHLNEIFEICDALTILRDGKFVDSLKIEDVNNDILVKKMVGRNVSEIEGIKRDNIKNEVILDVRNLTVEGVFKDISFNLKKNEIIGFSGLVGAKRTDVMMTIFGSLKKTSGEIYFKGKNVDIKSPKQAVEYGIGLVPENRKTQGFNKYFSNSLNIAVSHLSSFVNKGIIDYRAIHKNAAELGKRLNLRPNKPQYMTLNLSGGNQQKVVISKWLSADVEILILDEPTKGVDVGAKAEIYQILQRLVEEGKSIIVVSSELPEIMGLSDRIIVMREGEIVKELQNDNLTEEDILQYAMGVQ